MCAYTYTYDVYASGPVKAQLLTMLASISGCRRALEIVDAILCICVYVGYVCAHIHTHIMHACARIHTHMMPLPMGLSWRSSSLCCIYACMICMYVYTYTYVTMHASIDGSRRALEIGDAVICVYDMYVPIYIHI
jgi:hypothetical protein